MKVEAGYVGMCEKNRYLIGYRNKKSIYHHFSIYKTPLSFTQPAGQFNTAKAGHAHHLINRCVHWQMMKVGYKPNCQNFTKIEPPTCTHPAPPMRLQFHSKYSYLIYILLSPLRTSFSLSSSYDFNFGDRIIMVEFQLAKYLQQK